MAPAPAAPEPTEHLATADACFDAGDYAQAIAAYGEALRLDPDHVLARYNLGTSLLHAGRRTEAASVFRQVLARKPGFAHAAFNLALILQERNEIDEAIRYYWHTAMAAPAMVGAHRNLGALFARLERYPEAASCLQRVVQLAPEDPEAHVQLGNVFRLMNRLEDAANAYRGALERAPAHGSAMFNLGVVMLRLGRQEEALAQFDGVIARRPDFAEAHLNRGVVLRSLNRHQEASESFLRAIEIRPNYAKARLDLGDCYQILGRPHDAVEQYRLSLADDPDAHEALNHLGVILTTLGQVDEAIEVLERYVRMKPAESLGHMHLGIALAYAARHAEALYHYRQGVALGPRSALAWCNLGAGLHDLGGFDEAITCFQQAIAFDAAFAPAHTNEGIVRLLRGDYEAGWPKYEWRLKGDGRTERSPRFPGERWDGRSDLAGRTLLLHAEQGFGDTLQFVRYIHRFNPRQTRVLLELPLPLRDLVAYSFPEIDVIPTGAPLPRFDAFQSLMSLPLAFGTRPATIPAEIPYIKVPPERIAEWRRRLPANRKPLIGLVWAGGPAYPNDRIRSLPFAAVRMLTEMPGLSFVSLQKEIPERDRAPLGESPHVRRIGEEVKDFCDTAAIVASLDLVISADTSVAHLAGAMARPVWVMLPYVPDWRWMLDRRDSPWYPSATLFRQKIAGDWSGVIDAIADALQYAFAWRQDELGDGQRSQ